MSTMLLYFYILYVSYFIVQFYELEMNNHRRMLYNKIGILLSFMSENLI